MSGVFYRNGLSGVRPRAANGQFLPYRPTPSQPSPRSASPDPPAVVNTGIVHRDAHLEQGVVPGLGGVVKSPYERSLAEQ
jgi:hypothetical protein